MKLPISFRRSARLTRNRRWRRVAIVLAVLVALRIAAVPVTLWQVDRSLRARGLTCEVEDVDLTLWRGQIALSRMALYELDGAGEALPRALLRLEHASADLSVRDLLGGEIELRRVRVEGLEGDLDISTAGLARLASHAPDASDTTPDDDANDEPRALDLASPIQIDVLRVEHARLRLRDDTATPPFAAELEANLHLRDLGAPDDPTRIDFTLSAPGVLDMLRIRAEGQGEARRAAAHAQIEVAALRGRSLAGAWRRLGIEPLADTLSFEGRAELALEPHDSNPLACGGELRVGPLVGEADGSAWFNVARIAVAAREVSHRALDLDFVDVDGLSADFQRNEDGVWVVGGLSASTAVAHTAQGPAADAPKPAPGVSINWKLRALRVQAPRLTLWDRSLVPPAQLQILGERVEVTDMSPESTARFDVALRSPGVFDRLSLEGEANAQSGKGRLALDGLRWDAAVGYLKAAGLESDLESGRLRASVGFARDPASGHLRGSIDDFVFERTDGAQRFVSFDTLRAVGIDAGASGDPTIEELALTGLCVDARRDAEGTLRAFGLARRADSPARGPSEAAVPSTTTPSNGFRIERVLLQASAIEFRDDAIAPPLALTGAGFEVSIDRLQLASPPTFQQARARIALTPVLAEFTVDASLQTEANSGANSAATLTAAMKAAGVNLKPLAGYLEPVALAAEAGDGALQAKLVGRLARSADGWTASGSVTDLAWSQSGRASASIADLSFRRVSLGSAELRAGDWTLQSPRIAIDRDEEGRLGALGLRLLKVSPTDVAVEAPKPTVQTSAAAVQVSTGSIALVDANIEWSDRSLVPAVATTMDAELSLGPATWRTGGESAPFRLQLASGGGTERVTVAGKVMAGPDGLDCDAQLDLHVGENSIVERYLPQTLRPRPGDARVHLTVAARAVAEGGHALDLALNELQITAAGAEQPNLRLQRLHVESPRLDPAAGVVALGEVRVEGVSLSVERDAEGTLHLPMLSVHPAEPTQPAEASGVAPAEVRGPRRAPPAVSLNHLEIGVERATFLDRARDVPPIDVSLRVKSREALRWGSGEESRIDIELAAAAKPVLAAMTAELLAQPGSQGPRVTIDASAAGIDLRGLAARSATLADRIGEGSTTDAQLKGSLAIELRQEGNPPGAFDPSRDFGAEIALEGVELREPAASEPIAGLAALRIDVQRFAPSSGELHVRSVELERPSASFTRTSDGLHAFGCVWKTMERAAAAPTMQPTTAPEFAPRVAGPEVRVDGVVVREVDLRLRDETATPAAALTIDDLYAEVQRFTTRAFHEPLPVRFQLAMAASPQPMPARSDEVRAAFEEVAVSGSLELDGAPRGWIKLDLSALDLRNFSGPAAANGVELSDGSLDAGVRMRLAADGSTDVDSRFTFSDLDLAEDANGPLSRVLQLPAPVDVVLFALKDANEQHAVALSFHLEGGKLSTSEAIQAALAGFGRLVATAVASAPLRAVGTLTDLFGLTGEDDPLSALAVTLEYEPGEIDLSAGSREALAKAIGALADDEVVLVAQHAFGALDVEHVARVANPPPQECLELVARLRQRKLQLDRDREALSADARALYAVGRDGEAREASDRLRAVQRELHATEVSLDSTLELLRPHPERRAGRRTKLACIELAQARMDALADYIGGTTLERARERIELRRPTYMEPSADAALQPRGRILVVPRLRKSN